MPIYTKVFRFFEGVEVLHEYMPIIPSVVSDETSIFNEFDESPNGRSVRRLRLPIFPRKLEMHKDSHVIPVIFPKFAISLYSYKRG